MGIVFSLIDPRAFIEALQQADYRLVVAAWGVSLVWLLLRTLVWRTLLQERASFSQVFFAVNEGYLLNNFLPFRLGEVGRAYLLSRNAGLDFWQVLSTIVIERALDILMAAGLLLSTLPFVIGGNWALQLALVVGGIVLAGLLFLKFLAHRREWAMTQFDKIAVRIPILQRLGGTILPSFFNGLSVLADNGRFIRAITYSVLNWLAAILQYYLLLKAFYPQAIPLYAAFSLAVSALGIAAPSSPGSVGVWELTLVGALSVFGISPSTSLAFAITGHVMQMLTTGFFGAIGLARDGENLMGLYQGARRMLQRKPA